jgi:hypothetical protein
MWLQAHPERLTPQLLPAEHYLSRHRPVPFSLVAAGIWQAVVASPLMRMLRPHRVIAFVLRVLAASPLIRILRPRG